MRMNKIVRKLRPSDYWRIGEHESWFQDMAAKGFHLKKMGLRFVHFVKGEPEKMRYRIDISLNKRITPEQIEMYADSGWDYVTGHQYFQVYASPVERGAPELHTDPAEQSFTLKALGKKLVFNAVMVVVALLFTIGMLAAIWFLDGTPTFVLVDGLVIQQTLLFILFVYPSYISLQAAISIHALRKDLIEGKSINHHAPWKKHFRLNSVITFLFTIVAGLSAIVPIGQLIKSNTATLPEENLDLPIVRLADVEQNPALVRGEAYYMGDDVDWSNRYTYNWSPLAPIKYESDEHGVVPGKMWGDGSGEYSPSIRTMVYQLRVPTLADNLIADLIKRYNYEYSDDDFVETKHADLNLLIVHEEDDFKEVFASKGKAVIYVRYYGYADINPVIENIVDKIKFIAE